MTLNLGNDYCKRNAIQHIPIVERAAGKLLRELGLNLAAPEDMQKETHVTNWSLDPDYLADFLITIFDRWVCNDIGRVFIINFEWALSS